MVAPLTSDRQVSYNSLLSTSEKDEGECVLTTDSTNDGNESKEPNVKSKAIVFGSSILSSD